MNKLELKGRKIVSTFDYLLFRNYEEALKFGLEEMGWAEEEILDRTEEITVKYEDGTIETVTLSCIVVDTGSDDYLYYLG